MKNVGPLVEKLLKNYGLWQGYQQHRVIESWSDIVGPSLAEVTRAESISKGKLCVLVKDSVWAYHLALMKPRLIEKLNHHAGSNVVQDIFFKIEELEKKENS